MTTPTRTRRAGTPACYLSRPAARPSIDAAFKAAAQSRYAALRALGSIHRARVLNGIPCWLVVDYELARQALTHPALLKDDTPARDVLDAYLVRSSP